MDQNYMKPFILSKDKLSLAYGFSFLPKKQKIAAMVVDARECRKNELLSAWAYIIAPFSFLLAYMDIYSTNLSINLGAVEANPVVHGMMVGLGDYWFIPKIAAHCMVAAMILWWPNKPTLGMVTFSMLLLSFAVYNNFSIAFSA